MDELESELSILNQEDKKLYLELYELRQRVQEYITENENREYPPRAPEIMLKEIKNWMNGLITGKRPREKDLQTLRELTSTWEENSRKRTSQEIT